MGMLKEGVRLDRVRGGRQKYRRVMPYSVEPATNNNKKLALEGNIPLRIQTKISKKSLIILKKISNGY